MATSPDRRPTPSDFRYEAALQRGSVKRLRAAWKALLRFDPCPAPEIVADFTADMWAGDPVAEAFVDDVLFGADGPRRGRRLLEQAIEHGIDSITNPPPAMKRLFEEFERVPGWVEPDLVERGAAIWRRWGTDLFGVAGAGTLEMYTESAVALPLSLAGGYAGDAALRRFLETTRFWIDVSEPGALLRSGTDGRATAMRVRVMHVSVRRRVAEHEEWESERWGLPISQAYMMLTLLGGSVAPALAMWPLGYQTTAGEMRALLHYQRFLGHLMGVQPSFYPADIREAVQALFMITVGRSYTAGEHGAELIESFPRAFEPGEDVEGPLAWARAAYHHRLICAYTTLFMAPATRRRYDLPAALPWALIPMVRWPLIAGRESLRRVIPGLDPILDRRSRARRESWYREQMAGREAAFDAVSALRR